MLGRLAASLYCKRKLCEEKKKDGKERRTGAIRIKPDVKNPTQCCLLAFIKPQKSGSSQASSVLLQALDLGPVGFNKGGSH